MKSLFQAPNRPLTRNKAWSCVLMNLLAFPGMGTLMARRKVGFIQAAIMLIGFLLATGYVGISIWCGLQLVFDMYADSSGSGKYEWYKKYGWIGITGLAFCLAAWIWALFSSIEILKSTPKNPPPVMPPKIPPQ